MQKILKIFFFLKSTKWKSVFSIIFCASKLKAIYYFVLYNCFNVFVLFFSHLLTGSYNNFFRVFNRQSKADVTLEACAEIAKPRTVLKPRRVCIGAKRKKEEISPDSLDFTKKILHTAWHPKENIVAVAATNNLYVFQDHL